MDVIKRKMVSLRDQVEELETEYSKVCQEVEEKKGAREQASLAAIFLTKKRFDICLL